MLYTIIHNPRCSKSREALKILDNSKARYEIREYLKNPLDESEIRELSEKLWLRPIEFTRTWEDAFEKLWLSEDSSDQEVIKAMLWNAKLIQRPIIYRQDAAIIGRSAEKIIPFIKKRQTWK